MAYDDPPEQTGHDTAAAADAGADHDAVAAAADAALQPAHDAVAGPFRLDGTETTAPFAAVPFEPSKLLDMGPMPTKVIDLGGAPVPVQRPRRGLDMPALRDPLYGLEDQGAYLGRLERKHALARSKNDMRSAYEHAGAAELAEAGEEAVAAMAQKLQLKQRMLDGEQSDTAGVAAAATPIVRIAQELGLLEGAPVGAAGEAAAEATAAAVDGDVTAGVADAAPGGKAAGDADAVPAEEGIEAVD